jgi:predicted lactoylglutathione lyase
MANMIFVNLPVQDLDKSQDFFTQPGYSINQQFADEPATCVVISHQRPCGAALPG